MNLRENRSTDLSIPLRPMQLNTTTLNAVHTHKVGEPFFLENMFGNQAQNNNLHFDDHLWWKVGLSMHFFSENMVLQNLAIQNQSLIYEYEQKDGTPMQKQMCRLLLPNLPILSIPKINLSNMRSFSENRYLIADKESLLMPPD